MGFIAIGMGGALLWCWRSPNAGWPNLLLLVASVTLMALIGLALLQYRYFCLLLEVIEQQALQRRFPQAHRAVSDGEWHSDWFGSDEADQGLLITHQLLYQPSRWLFTRGLVLSLKCCLKAPVQLERTLAALQLLDRLTPALAAETVAPTLLRLPPVLQLEAIAIMTRVSRACDRRPQGRRAWRDLQAMERLMTPTASPDIFATALRYCLYLGPKAAVESIKVYLQQTQPPAVRAIAAAFVLSSGSCPSDRPQGEALAAQAEQLLRAMLVHELSEERRAASEALKELPNLLPFKAQIPALLEDFDPQVRKGAIAAICQTHSKTLYPHLLKALRSPLTEALAHGALVFLQDDAVPLLQRCTRHPEVSLDTKVQSWRILAEIDTESARTALAEDVWFQQGLARSSLLILLLRSEAGHGQARDLKPVGRHRRPKTAIAAPASTPTVIRRQANARAALLQALAGAEGVMQLVREELWLLSHCYAALIELHPKRLPGRAAAALRLALREQQRDVGERILMLLQIRYPRHHFEPISQQLRDRATLAQGLKRLEKILEPPLKPALLAVFDARSVTDKRASLSAWESSGHSVSEQLRRLIALEPGLDSTGLARAYELALEQEIALPDEALLRGINHAVPEVQAAAKAYLDQMPDAIVIELLQTP